MNIAIIIAVSDYKDLTNLPACSKDAELIHDLLKATDKYGENILYVASDTSSASIKEKIVTFVSNYKGKEIREVFFYENRSKCPAACGGDG